MDFTDADLKLLTQYNFAEAGNQNADVWTANTWATLNRLKSGEYGNSIPDVVNGMSTAIMTNSDQWQIASGQKEMNAYEEKVYKRIMATVQAVLRGKIDNPIGEATHFENIKAFGEPDWVSDMLKKTVKVGAHTYFTKKKKK